ncbi:MAG: septal ring lytic transglycosylase RlpA family protein [Polyangiaceae bacterium]|nr:septal ring lytic transglycosylase RlpA family protein [Polyangiaceae bacterium]
MVCAIAVVLAGCGPPGPSRTPDTSANAANAKQSVDVPDIGGRPRSAPDQVGIATWYGKAFAGRKMANGERFDPTKRTAAHRTLPLGTWVEVRRVDTGASVRVRITDRGPHGNRERIIDLSKKAASDIDLIRIGTARVELRIVDGP